jgi:uncharacterized protein YcfL
MFFILIACNSNQNNNKNADKVTEETSITIDSNVIKVFVDKSGLITLNGNPSSLSMLDSSFKKLELSKGVVYYSRDNVEARPPEESMQVMELIIKYSLTVKFYTDKTFTQTVKLN